MRQTSFLPAAHNSDKKRKHLFGIQFVSAKYQINLLQNVNSLPIRCIIVHICSARENV